MRKADAITQTVLLVMCLVTVITIYIPFLILLLIGAYQLITNTIATYNMKVLQPEDQTNLKTYWWTVLAYFSSLAAVILTEWEAGMIVLLAIVPWAIAIGATTMTYKRADRNGDARYRRNPIHHQFLDNVDFK